MKNYKEVQDRLQNLPDELLQQPRFFSVTVSTDGKKLPLISGWNKPQNQKLPAQVEGLVGFDTTGHGQADEYILFDFDHVLDDNGQFVNQDAEKWFNFVHSSLEGFCERSISRHGLHILAKPSPDKFPAISNGSNGVLCFDRDKDIKLEIFYKSAGRYCLMTGDLFRCEPNSIIPSGEAVDDVLQTILNEIQKQSPTVQKNSSKPALMDASDTPDYDSFRARRMLDLIPLRDLHGSDWLAAMSALKNLGFSYAELDRLNQGGKTYDEKENRKRFDSLDDPSFDIETLHGIAKRFGYAEKSVWHEYHKIIPAPEPNDKIKIWQEENGEIEPKFLAKLKNQAKIIQDISDFAQAAADTTTQKFLGAFQYYSCFAHISEKFFVDIKRAKENVAAKIKEFNSLKRNEELYTKVNNSSMLEKIAALTPTDSDLALTNINITALKNKVNTFETAAKKVHKRYLEQKELDALNEKYNAEKKAYEEKPPSIKDDIPDCPIDLILPLGCYVDNNKGIRIVDFDKPVGRNGRPVIEACQNIVVPTRALREVTKFGVNPKFKDQYEIAIKIANHWRRVIVDARTLQDARAVSALADFGAHITEPRMFVKFFAKILDLNEKNGHLPVTKVYLQPGWQDREFKFFAFPTGGNDYIVKNGDFDYNNIFSVRGDIDAWKNMLHRVIFHDPKNYSKEKKNLSNIPNVVAAMVLGSTFGAPLVAPLGIRNPQLVLGFDSGNGKTAAAKFAASFFGNPDELCPTCNATENFLEDLAVKLNDFPHAVDELQAAKKYVRENMDELVYKFSGGITRGRADIQGNAKPTFKYRGFRIFTGEQTIINNSSGQGAISRIFEITKAELFADPFAVEIHNFTQNNFGFFGKHYTTEFIPHNLARIREQFTMWRDVLNSDTSTLLSSHATFLAYTLTGLQFGLEAAGYSEEDALKITYTVVANMQDIIDDAPNKNSAKNVNRALPDIFDYLDSHRKQFIKEVKGTDDNEFLNPDSNLETLGVRLLNGSYAVFPLMLRKIINELDYANADAIIRALAKNNFLDCGNSKYQKFKKRLPAHFKRWFGKDVWFFIIKPPVDNDSAIAA